MGKETRKTINQSSMIVLRTSLYAIPGASAQVKEQRKRLAENLWKERKRINEMARNQAAKVKSQVKADGWNVTKQKLSAVQKARSSALGDVLNESNYVKRMTAKRGVNEGEAVRKTLFKGKTLFKDRRGDAFKSVYEKHAPKTPSKIERFLGLG